MSRELNVRIAQALGIDTRDVIGFHLRCWVEEAPRLRITKYLIDGRSITTRTEQFKLSLLDERPSGPLDLNAACYDAIVNVRATVQDAYERAHAVMSASFDRRMREIRA